MDKLLVICGPTASGKTKLAVDCAKILETEVISADSQLIYKDLNIGTAKPTKEEMRGVTHHLIDVIDPDCSFSVSDYTLLAEPIIENLFRKGKIPVICGGTGFYINSLLFDFSYGNVEANKEIRDELNNLLANRGKEYLFNYLKEVDPQTALKLHVNDTKRVIRALEIFKASGRKKSDICDGNLKKHEYLAIAIDYPREELYNRINERVDAMFDKGLVEEVNNLLSHGIDEKCQCMQAIGYKEVLECLKNGDKDSTMRDIIKRNTRRYAKRQITFFKKLEAVLWVKPEEIMAEKIVGLLNG